MKKVNLFCIAIVSALVMATGAFAGDISAPSAKGPRWEAWSPRATTDVGNQMFKVRECVLSSVRQFRPVLKKP